jgi:hypothetical protein
VGVYRRCSVLFYEYEIYFTSETGFLIFSRVQSNERNMKGWRTFTQYNVRIKNMTSQSILLFYFVIFTVKITECEDISFI